MLVRTRCATEATAPLPHHGHRSYPRWHRRFRGIVAANLRRLPLTPAAQPRVRRGRQTKPRRRHPRAAPQPARDPTGGRTVALRGAPDTPTPRPRRPGATSTVGIRVRPGFVLSRPRAFTGGATLGTRALPAGRVRGRRQRTGDAVATLRSRSAGDAVTRRGTPSASAVSPHVRTVDPAHAHRDRTVSSPPTARGRTVTASGPTENRWRRRGRSRRGPKAGARTGVTRDGEGALLPENTNDGTGPGNSPSSRRSGSRTLTLPGPRIPVAIRDGQRASGTVPSLR
jgi:hypothetical protein